MSKDCIFCKIISGAIPTKKIYEDDTFVGIRDILPHAKAHYLIFPKEHIASLNEVFPEDSSEGRLPEDRSNHTRLDRTELMGKLMKAGTTLAQAQGLGTGGFRMVINTGPDAGQTVFHLHLHILGGEILGSTFGRN